MTGYSIGDFNVLSKNYIFCFKTYARLWYFSPYLYEKQEITRELGRGII